MTKQGVWRRQEQDDYVLEVQSHTKYGERISPSPPTKNALLSTKTKVRFLNDVCLRQMMWASPNDVRFANDVWLCHILWQTSHHCETKWSNIIFAKQMHHIAVGDASFDKLTVL